MAAVTRYTADGVVMARSLVDRLSSAADECFIRAEQGIDMVEGSAVAVSEATWTAVKKQQITGIEVETTQNAVLRKIQGESLALQRGGCQESPVNN